MRLPDRLVVRPAPEPHAGRPAHRQRGRHEAAHERRRRAARPTDEPSPTCCSRCRRRLPPTPPDAAGAGRSRCEPGRSACSTSAPPRSCCLIGRVETRRRAARARLRLAARRAACARGGITDLERRRAGDPRRRRRRPRRWREHRLRSVTVNLTCGQPESRLFNVQWPVGGRAGDRAGHPPRRCSEGRGRAAVRGPRHHPLPAARLRRRRDAGRGRSARAALRAADRAAARGRCRRHRAAQPDRPCVARCELDVAELVSAPIAAGLATLVEDERELGATVIDMGGGTTGMAVFSEGQLLHTAQLPVGGGHVTNDIARLLSHAGRPCRAAEDAVRQRAGAAPTTSARCCRCRWSARRSTRSHRVPRSQVVGIIRPRLEETFELVRDRLEARRARRARPATASC